MKRKSSPLTFTGNPVEFLPGLFGLFALAALHVPAVFAGPTGSSSQWESVGGTAPQTVAEAQIDPEKHFLRGRLTDPITPWNEELWFVPGDLVQFEWRVFNPDPEIGKGFWLLNGNGLVPPLGDEVAGGVPEHAQSKFFQIWTDEANLGDPEDEFGEPYTLELKLYSAAGGNLGYGGHAVPNKMTLHRGIHDRKSMERYMDRIRDSYIYPALAGAIVPTDGSLPIVGTHGPCKLGEVAKTELQDRWHLGSCVKAMTATLVGVLAQKGLIDWNQSLATGIEELPNFIVAPNGQVFPKLGSMWQGCHKINFENLAAHRSGIEYIPGEAAEYMDQWSDVGDGSFQTSVRDVRSFLADSISEYPHSEPNKKFVYQNANYILIAAMLEYLLDDTYENLMRDHLLHPLGITNYCWGLAELAGSFDQTQPVGHIIDAGGNIIYASQPAFAPPAQHPSGGLSMSMGDWAKFIRLHINGQEGNLVLDGATLARLHTPFPANDGISYGWGWVFETDSLGGTVLKHNGSIGAFYCEAEAYLDRGFGVLAATNVGITIKGVKYGEGELALAPLMREMRYGAFSLWPLEFTFNFDWNSKQGGGSSPMGGGGSGDGGSSSAQRSSGESRTMERASTTTRKTLIGRAPRARAR